MKNIDNELHRQLFIQMGWVKPAIIDRYKGITYDALKSKRQAGKLKEGYHWLKSDGIIYFHFERINEYLEHGIQ